jgi:hypothetical protein
MTARVRTVDEMRSLLRLPSTAPAVDAFLGGRAGSIERVGHLGFVQLRDAGITVAFTRAERLVPASEVADPSALHVSSFHLHRAGHEGYGQYTGALHGGLAFGAQEADVVAKLGPPSAVGGGGMSTVLKRPIPRWLRYEQEGVAVHFQLDASGSLEMMTLEAPDVVGRAP